MKSILFYLLLIGACVQKSKVVTENVLSEPQAPFVLLKNEQVKMKVYLPDIKDGIYVGTRYDHAGIIGSVRYKGHEYFGFWKEKYDPLVGMYGPAETYKTAGLGYDQAEPGESFIRIGVGFVKKEDEPSYDYHNIYEIVDHGEWLVDTGEDWISISHIIDSDFGYGYIYKKTIRLKDDGFQTEYSLTNTGEKLISSDQYCHNFFMLDGVKCNPSIEVRYPYPVTTEDDLKGLMSVTGNTLNFTKLMERGTVFMKLKGYGTSIEDNLFTVENTESGAGVTVSVDQPLVKLEFWTNGKTLCPENTIQINVAPGEVQVWNSDYTLFVK